MRSTRRPFLVAVVLLLSTAVSGHAGLDAESYVELTIARLELIETAWRETGAPPPEEAMEELYEAHGTDREAYFWVSRKRRRQIETYLDKHPELRDTIDSLSAAIHRHVTQGEEP